jgi:Domain of unknown function (DUF4279)
MAEQPLSRISFATCALHSRVRSEAELLRLSPVSPDESWQMGAPRKGRMADTTHVHSGIQFQSNAREGAPPEEHVDELLRRLAPARSAFADFAREAFELDPETTSVQFRLVIKSSDPEVGVSLALRQLVQITTLGAVFLGVEVAFSPDP